jgi:exonuclease III
MSKVLQATYLTWSDSGQKEKRQRLFQWAKNQKTHILYAQETHFTKNTILSVKQEFSGDIYNSHGNSQSRGVSIFIKKELKYTIIDVHNDNDGRILLINMFKSPPTIKIPIA